MRLVLQPKRMSGRIGLDLVILEPDATLQDLIQALQPFAECHGEVYKLQLKGPGQCRGCVDSCCTTSIIAPDSVGFSAVASALGLTESEFLAAHCDPVHLERGQVRFYSRPCEFLSADGLCTIYQVRPLVCRLFICCTLSPALEALLQNALGASLAATVHHLTGHELLAHFAHPTPGAESDVGFERLYATWVVHAPTGNEVQVPAWHENPFLGAGSYAEIPLWSLVTSDDWHELTRGALAHPAPGERANSVG